MSIIIKIVVLYLLFRLIGLLLRKGLIYYKAYRVLKMKRRERAVKSKADFNLSAFDVEDAEFEELKPGSKDFTGHGG